MKGSSSTIPSNNYFSIVVTGIQSSIKHSRNKFFDFLLQIDINSFFINPTDKAEIKNIWSLDPLKYIGPSIIPTKILKLLSNDISTQFGELCNLSFSECVFLSQSFPYENHCECYKKLASSLWPVQFTLTPIFFLYIHSPLLLENKKLL